MVASTVLKTATIMLQATEIILVGTNAAFTAPYATQYLVERCWAFVEMFMDGPTAEPLDCVKYWAWVSGGDWGNGSGRQDT